MPFNVSEVLLGSAALLNDAAMTDFTYAAQLPYFKIAYDDLKQELLDNNIPISNLTSAALTITTSMSDIGGPTGPALPIDLIDIYELWERTAGTTNDYLLMTKLQFLPKTNIKTIALRVYTWQNQVIQFLGATSAVQVKIDYLGDPLGGVIDENTQVRVLNSTNFLKYRNAALCAEFIGENEERAKSLNENAGRALDTLLGIGIKSSQNIATRRRPLFRRAR